MICREEINISLVFSSRFHGVALAKYAYLISPRLGCLEYNNLRLTRIFLMAIDNRPVSALIYVIS